MIAKIELPLTGDMRKEICDRASECAGGYIEAIAKPDFSDWTAEEWSRFIGVMFDVIAADVFSRRIVVIPPAEIEYAPPY